MTFNEFRQLGVDEQELALWSQGVEVGQRRDTWFSYLLFQVDSFYIEVRFNVREEMIDRIVAFEDTDQLEPYLPEVDIDALYY